MSTCLVLPFFFPSSSRSFLFILAFPFIELLSSKLSMIFIPKIEMASIFKNRLGQSRISILYEKKKKKKKEKKKRKEKKKQFWFFIIFLLRKKRVEPRPKLACMIIVTQYLLDSGLQEQGIWMSHSCTFSPIEDVSLVFQYNHYQS